MKTKIGKIKHFTTTKLKEILDNPHHLTNSGVDYATAIDEVRDEYFSRLNKIADKENNHALKQYSRKQE